MGIEINGYQFEGPYNSPEELEDHSGVCIVGCLYNGESYVIDVGESSNVKSRVENHDREDCWEENCDGLLRYFVHYTPGLKKAGRVEIEKEIREMYDPPCGEE